MTRCRLRCALVLALVAGAGLGAQISLSAPQETKAPAIDLSEFRTVERAVTTTVSRSPTATARPPAYLGAHVVPQAGHLVVYDVEAGSPAADAGLQRGDILSAITGNPLRTVEALRELLHGRTAGDALELQVLRRGEPREVKVTLAATSRPMKPGQQRAVLGVQVTEDKDGVRVETVTPGLPAARSGLKKDDLIVKIDNVVITHPEKLGGVLDGKSVGDAVTLAVKRGDKTEEIKVRLAADPSSRGKGNGGFRGNFDDRRLRLWDKGVYRLAVVLIEYPDVKHNDQIPPAAWEDALFSKDAYTEKSPTGQKVWGSMNDYYQAQSYGKFRVTGKVFDYVEVKGKQAEYGKNANRFTLLTEAFDKILERDGENALNNFDGVFFVVAGKRVQTQRGGLYWPHKGTFRYKGTSIHYFICPEGGARMETISVISHEFGHMLGLPDLYARPESPGMEGLGIWCTMSTGHGKDGKPLHYSAWCKEQLGWLTPAVIDPREKQKLILAPVDTSPKECYKVLVRQDGSEYLLLENRVARGWDRDLPGQGMIIWRVVNGRPILEESHGVSGPAGPRLFLSAVPYPSKANNAFTPYTTPSSASPGGGLPVHISNIQRLPDGRIIFYVGYEFL